MISIFVEQEAVILPFTSNFFVNTKFHSTLIKEANWHY